MKKTLSNWKQWVRTFRRNSGISTIDFANMLGFTLNQYRRFEEGYTDQNDLKMLVALTSRIRICVIIEEGDITFVDKTESRKIH